MTVTKQQQLEWLAKEFDAWPGFSGVALRMSDILIGKHGCQIVITQQEWQQERDKMSSKPEVDNSWHEHKITNQELKQERDKMQKKQEEKLMSENEFEDALEKMYWDFDAERAKKAKCERLNFKMFMRIASGLRVERKQDNSWHEHGELPPVGCECGIRYYCWNSEKYEKVTVAAITSEYVIVKYAAFEQHYMLKDISFRPLRTEREKAIDEIAALVRNGLVSPEMAKEFAVKMYDAGLKVVNP